MKDFLNLVTKNIPLTALIIIGIILLIIVVVAIVIKVMKPTEEQKANIHKFLDDIKDDIKEKINLTLASTHTNYLDFAEYQAQLINDINLAIAEHVKDAMDNCISDPKLQKIANRILTADFVEEFASIIINDMDIIEKAKKIFDENINDVIENINTEEEEVIKENKIYESGEDEDILISEDDYEATENFVDEYTKAREEFESKVQEQEELLEEPMYYSDDDETVETVE